MRLSELNQKTFLANDGVGDNSYVVITYAEDASDQPVSFKASLNELGRLIVSNMKLAQYDIQNEKKDLGTLVGVSRLRPTPEPEPSEEEESEGGEENQEGNNEEPVVEEPETEEEPIEREVYNPIHLGQFLTDTDRPLLTNLEANYTDASAANNKFIWKLTRTDGTLAASHADFSPAFTWTNAVVGTNDAKPSITITVAGNTSSSVTPNTATTTVYGITKLSDAIDSSDSTVAATAKAVLNALQSLDITQITNSAGKTIATIDEADGKVSATFQDIQIAESQVTNLTTDLSNKLETSLKGANSGLAELDASGKVPSSQLPSYVDDILEYNGIANFPAAANAESGKIYVDTATNTSYRWSGSQYTKVASDLSLGETEATAYRGDRGAAAYAAAVTNPDATPTENSTNLVKSGGVYNAIAALDSTITGTPGTANTVTALSETNGIVTATFSPIAIASTQVSGLGTAAVKNVPTTGNAGNNEVVLGNDSRLTDARNAADVPSWAKAADPPTYTISDISGAAPTEAPTFTTSITLGSTTITEAQLQALLAMIPASEPEPQGE